MTNHVGPVSNRDGNRSVIFSDGIRPGDENSHLDGSDTTPSSRVRRRSKSKNHLVFNCIRSADVVELSVCVVYFYLHSLRHKTVVNGR